MISHKQQQTPNLNLNRTIYIFLQAKKTEKLSNTTNFNAFDTNTEADSLFSEIKEMDAENRGTLVMNSTVAVNSKTVFL